MKHVLSVDNSYRIISGMFWTHISTKNQQHSRQSLMQKSISVDSEIDRISVILKYHKEISSTQKKS